MDSQQQAFDHVKQQLISAPLLAYPNAKYTFVLDTDASNIAIGGVLSQIQNEVERVVCYGSYILTPAQRKYCTTRKELLAIVRFTRQYRHYLLGKQFVVRTDHNSLTWLLRFKYIEGQLARWIEELSQYDMILQHRPGNKHGNADGLSCIPDRTEFCDCYQAGVDVESLPCHPCSFCSRAHEQWSRFEIDVDDVVPLAVKSVTTTEPETGFQILGYSHAQLVDCQAEDPVIQKLRTWVESEVVPKQSEIALCCPAVKYFYINKERLVSKDGLLYYKWEHKLGDRLLLIVPKELQQEVLALNHDLPLTGHMGIKKTLA